MAIPLLPTLLSVSLNNFSLYSRQPDIRVGFDRDVFCLAGANGLGKSTFLAVITYALTGRVPEPERAFLSISDYVRESRDFTRDYFKGRINAIDLDIANVTVVFSLGTTVFEVVRGFERPEDVSSFTITKPDSVERWEADDNVVADDEPLHVKFEKAFCETSGLRQFDQFVFLQHFVLTFDERRHLIFWESRLTEPALFLGFGGDSEIAARASQLRGAMEKQGSRARNSRWQATATRARIAALKSSNAEVQRDSESAGDSRLERVRAAHDRRKTAEARVSSIQQQLVDAHVNFGEVSATLASASRRLESAITNAAGRRNPWRHSSVLQMQSTGVCVSCNSRSTIAARLASAQADRKCPICGDEVPEGSSSLSPAILELDAEASRLRESLHEAERNLSRIQYELVDAEGELNQAVVSLEEFELEDRISVQRVAEYSSASLEVALAGMEAEADALTREADTYIEARDALRRELDPLLEDVANAYRAAEQDFVPLFRDLAEQFIGLPLDIDLVTSGAGPMGVGLSVDGKRRAKISQLSESQRFFLDIALRMALVKYMCAARGSAATLYVDTPEGSLDIAYESRAGELFASYADDGRRLVMTSNINSSKLLLRLAEKCGAARLHLEPMTDWSTLSQVQIEEADLFRAALEDIRSAQAGR